MTARSEDPNLLVWLQRLQADVTSLKSGAGVKQNNIRLGDWVCDINDDGCLVSTNVKSGEQTITCAGNSGLFEIMWSTPGDIDSDTLGALTFASPVWYPHSTVQIVEVCLFFGANFLTGFGTFEAQFMKNGTVFATAAISDETSLKNVTASATTATADDEISVKMSYDDEAFPAANRLTALLRYQYV